MSTKGLLIIKYEKQEVEFFFFVCFLLQVNVWREAWKTELEIILYANKNIYKKKKNI